MVNNADRNKFIVETFAVNKEKYGQTIVFALNVNHAIALSALFNHYGIKSGYVVSSVKDAITGVTRSREDNAAVYEAYSKGKLQVLVNVNILTEGVDLPKTQTVFLTRPTVSKILMTQMIGRALRGEKAGGTKKAYIVSFIDNGLDKIAWSNPETIFEGNNDFADTKTEYEKRDIRLIAISKIEEFAKMLNDFVTEVYTACIASPLLYWDDTVVFINTARACFRFYGNEKLALYCAHMKKDLPSVFEDGVLPALPPSATVMHDHNSISYHKGFLFRNVECLQHLERDLQKVIDASGHSWAASMKELVKSTIHRRKQLISQGFHRFDDQTISDFLCDYDAFLHIGYREYSKECNRYFSPFENALLIRLNQYRDNYTEWVRDFSVPTTNNISERSLRFIKCKDKISGQFQSERYAQFFAAIRTYIETCARNGINEFQAILRLTQGNPFSLCELLSPSGAT